MSCSVGDPARSINPHYMLVELLHLYYDSSFVPLGGVQSSLMLDPHTVSDSQRWKRAGVSQEAFGSTHVPVTQCLLTRGERLLPCAVWLILSRVNGYEVMDQLSENAHGVGVVCLTVRCVAILEHGILDLISVECALSISVVSDEALYNFDSHLSMAVTMGEGDG